MRKIEFHFFFPSNSQHQLKSPLGRFDSMAEENSAKKEDGNVE
jgi:hypothetical protein